MKKIIPLASIFLLAATPAIEMSTPQNIASQNNQFAFAIFNEIKAGEKGNIFYSPFSISTALAMTYAGAEGTTAEEMANTMRFSPNTNEFHYAYGEYLKTLEKNANHNIQLRIANRLWGDKNYELQPTFIELNKEAYNSPLEKVNFIENPDGSRKEINQWVENKTENRIVDLIPAGTITSDTRLVLTNAIYFKGDWLYKFKTKDTKDQSFYLPNGKKKKTAFMNFKGGLEYAESSTYKILRLPYKGDKQSMILVLPNDPKGLPELEEQIDPRWLNQVFNGFKPEVILALPKFKMTIPLSLNGYLKEMGMSQAFNNGADFSKMSPSNNLFISDVIHKAFIEINEEGTEAAAATAVIMSIESIGPHDPPIPKEFIADHPFLFYIVDNETKAILFMGRLIDPVME